MSLSIVATTGLFSHYGAAIKYTLDWDGWSATGSPRLCHVFEILYILSCMYLLDVLILAAGLNMPRVNFTVHFHAAPTFK